MPKTPTALKTRLHNAFFIKTLTPRQAARIAADKARKLNPVSTIDKPKPKPVPLLLATLTNRQLMDYTGVHFTTVYRWRRQNELPPHIEKLLRFVALHQLDQLGWKEWRIENGMLISPSGNSYSPGQVEAIQLRQQELAFYAAERRDHLRRPDQPSPYADPDDKFLKEAGEALKMNLESAPAPMQVDELEHEGPQKKEIDPWILEERKRKLKK